jgi:hypothetical protein
LKCVIIIRLLAPTIRTFIRYAYWARVGVSYKGFFMPMPPYIKLYIKDVAFNTSHMTDKQLGAYMREFFNAYRLQKIPEKYKNDSIFEQLFASMDSYEDMCNRNRQNRTKSSSCNDESSTSGKQVVPQTVDDTGLTINQEPLTKNHKPLTTNQSNNKLLDIMPDDWNEKGLLLGVTKEQMLVMYVEFKAYYEKNEPKKGVKPNWKARWHQWIDKAIEWGKLPHVAEIKPPAPTKEDLQALIEKERQAWYSRADVKSKERIMQYVDCEHLTKIKRNGDDNLIGMYKHLVYQVGGYVDYDGFEDYLKNGDKCETLRKMRYDFEHAPRLDIIPSASEIKW